jgi:hypothetical protein
VLVERAGAESKWLREVDYKGLVNFIRMKDCPEEVIPKVLVIVDHVIYIDTSDELTFELVRGCEVVPIIWAFREQYFGLVMNIMVNLACQEQYKQDLDPYVHLIFLNVSLTNKTYLLYQFINNWFSSQAYELRTSRDQLIVKILADSAENDRKTVELEAAIWIRLVENNNLAVPRRIVEHDN